MIILESDLALESLVIQITSILNLLAVDPCLAC